MFIILADLMLRVVYKHFLGVVYNVLKLRGVLLYMDRMIKHFNP